MKKLLATLFLSMSLIGCATQAPIKPSVIVEYKYVAAPIPEKHLEIPAAVEPLDFNTDPKPTQKDVAEWIAKQKLRADKMETNLLELKKYQDEQKKKENAK